MNLLLVEPAELGANGTCTLPAGDRRAEHVRGVLGARVGSTIRAGVIGGKLGTAAVIADAGAMTLRLDLADDPPPQLAVDLVLAIPRPKVLARVIETCAAFGVRRIDLTNAWRVDKSYLRSPKLAADALAHAARLGAEQGATTHVPRIRVFERLMARIDEPFEPATKLIAHPRTPPIEAAATPPLPCVLAIGPERGWIERELATFVERGFTACSIGAPILRVEAAVSAALAQLMLLARR
ncbi:MAG TPA: RsmE family RNA methyltransferase [Kofleriaceae bacterium]|nr:RsmE family RNA methyltransferase [Kofleriaceae bacterium]